MFQLKTRVLNSCDSPQAPCSSWGRTGPVLPHCQPSVNPEFLMVYSVKWEHSAATPHCWNAFVSVFFSLSHCLPQLFFCTVSFSLCLLWHQWQMSVRNCPGPVWLSKDKTICSLANEQFITFLIIVISLAGGAMYDIFTTAKDAGTSFMMKK